jgi:VanZ family protein
MSLIFYLSSIPGNQLGPDTIIVNTFKKLGHYFIFGVLAALYLYSFKGKKPLLETQDGFFLLSLILALLYSMSDEYHQSFTPGRHSSEKDVLIDFCGALTVLVILYALKTRKKRKHERYYCYGKTIDH